jgi:hypothetical protein
MLNSGKKFRALRDKKNNILILVLFEKKILNEIKNHNPPLLQVKWSVPYKNKNKQNKEMIPTVIVQTDFKSKKKGAIKRKQCYWPLSCSAIVRVLSI